MQDIGLYIKIIHSKKIKHSENLGQKIEGKITFLSEEFSPKKTLINKGKFEKYSIVSDVIKGENSSLIQTPIIKHLKSIVNFSLDRFGVKTTNTLRKEELKYSRICEVTGLDISMQKANSRYLCFSGLKYYLKHFPEVYKDLEAKYLTRKAKGKDLDAQIYYMAHNIRNAQTNKKHNRKKFEARNYPVGQLSLFY